jgi:hypothetical protein
MNATGLQESVDRYTGVCLGCPVVAPPRREGDGADENPEPGGTQVRGARAAGVCRIRHHGGEGSGESDQRVERGDQLGEVRDGAPGGDGQTEGEGTAAVRPPRVSVLNVCVKVRGSRLRLQRSQSRM